MAFLNGAERFGKSLERIFLRCCRALLPATSWGDRIVAGLEFLLCHGRFPERRPVRYSDHLFALRTGGALYDPLRQFVTDKEYVKLYVEMKVGARYNVQTYRILRTEKDVDTLLPQRFPCVVKPTNGVGRMRICQGPEDVPDRETLLQWLAHDYYRDASREHNYRHLRQKIIFEEFVTEDGLTPAPDYKIFCFHGRPRFIQVETGRFTDDYSRSMYDSAWNRLPASVRYPPGRSVARPPMLPLMLSLAARLAEPFDFIRVDLYGRKSEVRVGELTNCPGRATAEIRPPSAQFLLGRYFREPR